jgi:putative hydrolase of the HAD superfamily
LTAQRYDAVLFDFFGTLVQYSPSRTEQGYDRSYEVFRSMGGGPSYPRFLEHWSATSEAFDDRAEAAGDEFSMDEVVAAFLRETIGTSRPDDVVRFRDTYIAEWSTAVVAIPGVPELLRDVAQNHAVAVVTNTHDFDLVPRLLDAHGLAGHVSTTVMSVDVRCRKPYAGIFQATIDRLGVEASRCLFVGDSYVPDYVGPTRFGMDALLIGAAAHADVPEHRMITSVLDVGRTVA